jgi:hypothetical protein
MEMNGLSLLKMAETLIWIANCKTVTLDSKSAKELFIIGFNVYLKRSTATENMREVSNLDHFTKLQTLLVLIIQPPNARTLEKVGPIDDLSSSLTIPASTIRTQSSPVSQKHLFSNETLSNPRYSTMVDSFQASREFDEEVNSEKAVTYKNIFEDEDHLEAVVRMQLVFIIDQVDLYIERISIIEAKYGRSPLFFTISKSIPFMVVPKTEEKTANQYKTAIKVSLLNEKGNQAGIYGWCFSCRSKADFYCKDSRVPICGISCKSILKSFIWGTINTNQSYTSPETSSHKDHSNLTKDKNLNVITIIQYIYDLSAIEMASPNVKELVLITLLDCIDIILDKIPIEQAESVEFKEIHKLRTIKILGSFLLLFGPKITNKTTNILLNLFRRFRHLFKGELYAILEGLILKSLKGPYLPEEIREPIQGFLLHILNDKAVLADLFLYYDCQRGYGNLLENLFNYLGTIN